MTEIYFELTNSADLTGFAAQDDGYGGWTLSTLPAGMDGVGGIYVILNETAQTPNRYVGIAQDLGHRFTTRLASVCELGISADALRRIYVYWGKVWTMDATAKMYTHSRDYSAPLRRTVNGIHQINLEKLLIRYFMAKFTLSGGHTMTNNMLIKTPYTNPTLDIKVTLEWKYVGGGNAKEAHVWGSGESW